MPERAQESLSRLGKLARTRTGVTVATANMATTTHAYETIFLFSPTMYAFPSYYVAGTCALVADLEGVQGPLTTSSLLL